MCGIAGYIDFNNNTSEETITKMLDTIIHRGPDDSGEAFWYLDSVTIGLGHRRLSIIDLSEGGKQPMFFRNLSIIFNGEIYNYKEIKIELESIGHSFKTFSDTEVIIHAFAEWGDRAIEKLIGMFAIVIYDRNNKRVTFIRDRAGVKPLFIYWKNGLLLFASELKAFHQHPYFEKKLNSEAIQKYMRHGYVPAPLCIFQDTCKVEAGEIQEICLKTRQISKKKYWDIRSFYFEPRLKITYEDAKTELHNIFKSACEYRMVADVPIGVFLSGGYDSTAVTAILQKQRSTRLKTFTIGFEEGNNEAPFARQTADYLGTDHSDFFCRTKEAQQIIPTLPFNYDEPFGDSSAIPTILVSKLAKEQVRVALSADGGDEVFIGYENYTRLLKFNKQLDRVPNSLKKSLSNLLECGYPFIPDIYSSLKHKIYGIQKALNKSKNTQAFLLHRYSSQTPQHILKNCFLGTVKLEENWANMTELNSFHDILDASLFIDYSEYLNDDILTKVDRATMSVSLEGREPLLDHRIAEFVARLPMAYKYDKNLTKLILKDIVHEYVPQSIMNRPKTGFSLPIYKWLNGDLYFLLEEYLSEDELSKPGCWNVEYCYEQVKLFKKKQLHYSPFIWYLLMFQMWYKKWM
jgi:asparagine synthase (glutamine-hydrolysing)